MLPTYFHASFTLAWSLSNATNRRRRLESHRSRTNLHFSSVTIRSSPSCSVVTACLCAMRSHFIHTCINSHNLSSKSSAIFKTLPLVLCLNYVYTATLPPHDYQRYCSLGSVSVSFQKTSRNMDKMNGQEAPPVSVCISNVKHK